MIKFQTIEKKHIKSTDAEQFNNFLQALTECGGRSNRPTFSPGDMDEGEPSCLTVNLKFRHLRLTASMYLDQEGFLYFTGEAKPYGGAKLHRSPTPVFEICGLNIDEPDIEYVCLVGRLLERTQAQFVVGGLDTYMDHGNKFMRQLLVELVDRY